VPSIVSDISQYTWMVPGGIIFTSTSGVTRALKPGDVVEMGIAGIGKLTNPVVAEGK
jgi:2-keto-4-pentenoate hydratase/2-oxohepta-3-ene-1,7-dioic acid hydratase in catechol pathway